MVRADEWRLKVTQNVDRMMAKAGAAVDAAASRFTRMQDRVNRGLGGIKQAGSTVWDGMKNSALDLKAGLLDALPIPSAMGSSLASLAGPLGIAVGLAGALGAGMAKGLQAAEAYGKPFRELRNLNQDKSVSQMQALNDRVLNLASTKGLDATQLVTGVYDVQSTIGEFGPAVEAMVADVGVASRALNMDFGQAVNGVSKALVQFKLPLSDVNRLLESNAKTVQVGVVTFDELSKVQTEYAGAASSMNQELDTANKVFALLTTSTKNADIAATMAKASFQDIGKGDTVAGLKKIGVDVFDAQGKMRQMDDILRELVPKLGGMSDQSFARLKEEIGGSEGLRGLLDMTKASGSEVLRVLDSFDNTKFDIGTAIAQANDDLDVQSQILDGKMSASWTKLGQTVAPMWNGIRKGWINDLDKFSRDLEAMARGWALLFGNTADVIKARMNDASKVSDSMNGAREEAFKKLNAGDQKAVLEGYQKAMPKMMAAANAEPDQVKRMQTMVQINGLREFVNKHKEAPVPQGKAGSMLQAPSDQMSGLFADKKTTGRAAGDGVRQGVSEVVGGGKQVRNVNITIQSLIKELKVMSSGGVKESSSDIQRIVTETLVRAVQGGELTMAND